MRTRAYTTRSKSRSHYEEIMTQLSDKNDGRKYTIKKDIYTGKLTCNCPAWIFNKSGDRTCKHVQGAKLLL